MTNDPFYLIGRLADEARAGERMTNGNGNTTITNPASCNIGTTLRTLGWSAATFGAGAILGWIASGRLASAKRAGSW
ncbi:hypothetical protein A4U49_06090 [Acidithiobacillus ferrivorans]|nr:hypothetical protein A4U49_06090 [Acidithiobacillus ferrivorans]